MFSTVVAGIGYGTSFSPVADTAVGAVARQHARAAAPGVLLCAHLGTLAFRWRPQPEKQADIATAIAPSSWE